MLHVTNGDSAAETIRATGIRGEVLPWRDVLHEGPLTPGVDLKQLTEIRARFLADAGWGDFRAIRRDMRKRNRTLLKAREVTLWFEHDLYDQLQLIQILDALAGRKTAVHMISIGEFPGVEPFHGLGQLSAEQMATLWPQRTPVSEEQFATAQRAWAAVRAGEVPALLETDLSPLPFLRAAMVRYLEEQPSGPAGLSRTERQILAAVVRGARTFVDAFRASQAMEEAPFLGDCIFRQRLERLQKRDEPLLTPAPYGLTEAGKRVRAELRFMPAPTLEEQLQIMREDWDNRARENAKYYVATGNESWTDEEFFRSGEQTVSEEILTDMTNICQGKDPKQMRVLEIGCGAGRITRAFAQLFGEVHAVDVSGEMVQLAKNALAGFPNAFVYQNNGRDLSVVPDKCFDFAFSTIVFQHIPSRDVIYSYVREVHRLLRPGGLFKFQVQGGSEAASTPDDTWLGVPFSDEEAVELAEACGFEPRYRHGAGSQYFWLWFFKNS